MNNFKTLGNTNYFFLSFFLLFLSQFGYSQSAPKYGTEFRVNNFTTDTQLNSDVAMDDAGNYVVVWQSFNQDGDKFGIYGQRYNKVGAKQGGEFRVNTTTTNNQKEPAVAIDNSGNFIVVWYGKSQGVNKVYGKIYRDDGSIKEDEFEIYNTTKSQNKLDPAVAMDANGNFVVVWENSVEDGDGFGIVAQRHLADGAIIDTAFVVNTTIIGDQGDPIVDMNEVGDFIIGWSDFQRDNIYAQSYNADGTPRGGEFQVNTFTTNTQEFADVVLSTSRKAIFVWNSNGSGSVGQDGDDSGVFAQEFDQNNNKIGSEFQVNTTTNNDQQSAAIAMDGAGNFTIVWDSDGQDGSAKGVYGQSYNADGTKNGNEFRVNTYTSDDQRLPAIAMSDAGNFVVTWESLSQDGSAFGVYGQLYRGENDFCNDAINLSIGSTPNFLNFTTMDASYSASLPNYSCFDNTDIPDVWFKTTVNTTDNIVIETKEVSGGLSDMVMQVLSGSCGNLTEIACNDFYEDGSGQKIYMPKVELVGRPVGEEIYIRLIDGFSGGEDCFGEPDPGLFCSGIVAPVCGCDGNTYTNSCVAKRAGILQVKGGECDGSQNLGGDFRLSISSKPPSPIVFEGVTVDGVFYEAQCDNIINYEEGAVSQQDDSNCPLKPFEIVAYTPCGGEVTSMITDSILIDDDSNPCCQYEIRVKLTDSCGNQLDVILYTDSQVLTSFKNFVETTSCPNVDKPCDDPAFEYNGEVVKNRDIIKIPCGENLSQFESLVACFGADCNGAGGGKIRRRRRSSQLTAGNCFTEVWEWSDTIYLQFEFEDCPTDTLLNQSFIESGSYFAENSLTASAELEAGSSVRFVASNSIILSTGFSSNNASFFEAKIEEVQNCTNTTATRSKEVLEKASLEVFPNPSSSHANVQIELPKENENAQIQIFNSNGQLLEKIPVITTDLKSEISIHTNNWNSGLYFVHLLTDKQIITKKLLVLKN
ncbi:MAG: T9SS type A sorting domain-containing protein [Bacteroidota bacterium]